VSDRAATTRESLLDAAERLFAAQGYDAVGIREISAAAGVNLAAIKYHFGSKRELYLETVLRAMERQGGSTPWAMLEALPRSRAAAARLLVRFVRGFVESILASPELGVCGQLMLREAMCPSEAIDAVVTEFTRPHQELLIGLVGVLRPELDRRAQELAAHSIIGQVLHFMIQRPFLARQSELDLEDARELERVADHVSRFSLLGLGCTQAFVRRTLESEPARNGTAAPRRAPRRRE
jgi:AcrR family transcriptional regulator